MTPADAIRELGRGQAYLATFLRGGRGVASSAFLGAHLACTARADRALNEHIGWLASPNPATIRRRAEALARQMEIGAQMAGAASRRWRVTETHIREIPHEEAA